MTSTPNDEDERPNPHMAFINALKIKDSDLYDKLRHVSPRIFWREWKKVYPEDFPQGADSPANPSSIVPKP
jgi:hypothetical protein